MLPTNGIHIKMLSKGIGGHVAQVEPESSEPHTHVALATHRQGKGVLVNCPAATWESEGPC